MKPRKFSYTNIKTKAISMFAIDAMSFIIIAIIPKKARKLPTQRNELLMYLTKLVLTAVLATGAIREAVCTNIFTLLIFFDGRLMLKGNCKRNFRFQLKHCHCQKKNFSI